MMKHGFPGIMWLRFLPVFPTMQYDLAGDEKHYLQEYIVC